MHQFRIRTGCLLAFILLSTVVSRSGFGEEEFEVDNSHASVIFSVSHFNIGYIYGRFNTVTGSVTMDRDNPASSKFNFLIETKSIDTNDAGRDTHLKGEDFFAVETFPKIEFESSEVSEARGNYRVTGKLKMHGQEQEVTIPLQLLGVGKGPFGNMRMGMIGKFSIKRSEFGMNKMLDGIGDDVAITLSFEGILK